MLKARFHIDENVPFALPEIPRFASESQACKGWREARAFCLVSRKGAKAQREEIFISKTCQMSCI